MDNNITFRRFSPEERAAAENLLHDNFLSAEVMNYLELNAHSPIDGALWCGYNNKNRLYALIYDNGSYTGYFSEKHTVFYLNEYNASVFSKPAKGNRLYPMVIKQHFPFPEEKNGVPLRGDDLKQAFCLMEDTAVLSDAAAKAYIHRCRSINRGLAETFGLTKNGRLLSTGSVVAIGKKTALIGDIDTDFSHRCEGLGTEMLYRCVNFSLQKQKIPFLLCKRDKLSFYKKRGFRRYHG